MKIKISFFIILISMFNMVSMQAQEHHHVHAENEIGLSGGAVYTFEHNEWGAGIHMHYFRMLSAHSKWSLGVELESVWADGNHFTVGAGVKYEIIDRLSIGLLPGISFFQHNDTHPGPDNTDYKSQFSLHTEVVYDLFHWEHFHLGPAVDYSWTAHDAHFAIGIHGAYCF